MSARVIHFQRRSTRRFFLAMVVVFLTVLLWPHNAVKTQGTTITVCSSGCDYVPTALQTAMNAATSGTTILLESGHTFPAPGTGWVMGDKCGTPAWDCITMRTGVTSTGEIMSLSLFPVAGERVTRAQAAIFAKIIPTANTEAALRSVYPGEVGSACTAMPCTSDGWSVKWIDFGPKADYASRAIVRFGTDRAGKEFQGGTWVNTLPNGETQDTLDEVPQYMTLYQSYIHGDPFRGQHQGLFLGTKDARVMYNIIDDIKSQNETQAITMVHGVGPVEIIGNELNATGENIITGGSDSYLRLQATITGTPTTTSFQLTNPVYTQLGGTTVPASLTSPTIYSGIWVSLVHGGVGYGGIKCILSGTTCTLPAGVTLPFTPTVGDVVKWSRVYGGLTFKYNWFYKKPEWFDPILSPPSVNTPTTSTTGGTLAASTQYCYKVITRALVNGGTTVNSAASAEQCVTTGASTSTNKVTITWTADPNASSYYVYGRTTGAQAFYFSVTAPATTLDDTGATGTAGTPPTSGSLWWIKNSFELKQGDGDSPSGSILIEGNVIDHSECCDQDNIVSLKTNNQNGNDPSGTVRNVMVRNNWIHSGYRALALTCTSASDSGNNNSGPMDNITFDNNLFSDLSTVYVYRGTPGNAASIISTGSSANSVVNHACTNITWKHNTFLIDDTGIKGPLTLNIANTSNKFPSFTLQNNIMGKDCTTASCVSNAVSSLKGYNPNNAGQGSVAWNATVDAGQTTDHNAWPDGTSTTYTAAVFPNSFFPTSATLIADLTNYTNCKLGIDISGCALKSTSSLWHAASDGADVGANIAAIKAFTDITLGTSGTSTAPVVGTVPTPAGSNSASVLNVSVTTSGTDRYLACGIATQNNTRFASSVVFNTTESMTKLGSRDFDNASLQAHAEYWYLINPTATTANATMTLNGATAVAFGCIPFSNVNQTSPHGTPNDNGGSSALSTVDVVSALNELVLDVTSVRVGTTGLTEGAGQTNRVEKQSAAGAGNVTLAMSTEPGASTTTMSWSVDDTTAKSWAVFAVSLKGSGPANTAPTVNAGVDASITYPSLASLNGTVVDDGLPSGTLTYTWTKVSGPGTVAFGDATLVDTTASFSVVGTYVLRLAVSDGDLSAQDDVSITVNTPSADFTIQAEDYDLGGEGVGYHDLDSINQGGAYRTDGVDIESTGDTGGGYDVGFAFAGEWLKFTTSVVTTGTYTLSFRVASSGVGGTFHLEVDNVDVTGPISVPTTGGWQTFTTLTKSGVALTAGTRVLKLALDTNGPTTAVGNFNWLALALGSSNTAPTVDVGIDLTTTLPAGVALTAITTDDGPPTALTFSWTMTSGPGTVAFGDATFEDTTASFSTAGTYVLRLTASDGQLSGFDELTVTVNAAPVVVNTLRADRFLLNTGACAIRSGSGPPGSLGGCDVYVDTTNGRVYGQSASLTALTSANDLLLNAAGKDILPELNFDQNLGSEFKKYATVWASELKIDTLVAQDVISTIGGRVIIAPTTILEQDIVPSTTTITVRHNSLNTGDRIRFEGGGNIEFMGVTSSASGTGPYTYSVTRDIDGTGANSWIAGSAITNTGQAGNGFIDLYANHGLKAIAETGPTIVGNVRNSLTYNDWSPRWAIGNLNGVYNYTANTYGVAMGSATGTNVTIDATNGFRIRNGTTNKLVADTAGNLSLTGNLTVGTSGVIHSAGATSYSAGTGYWMEGNATPVFRIGNPAGNQLTWDGSALAVNGTLTSVAGSIGGWSIITGYLFSGSTTTARVGLHASDTATDVAIYAGNFTETLAPFRVLHNGSLFASSATITGSITATSGNITAALVAGSITADKLNVTSLSAISANLGTITAGTISGITINGSTMNAGGGAVTIDANGISLTAGSAAQNNIKWSDGSDINSVGTDLALTGGTVTLVSSGTTVQLGTHLSPTTTGHSLGQSSTRWHDLYLAGTAYIAFLAGGGQRFVCVDNSGMVFAQSTACQ